ncbi:YkgJ family cysteine cluster protein [uncultured Prochlorococcus sp.]|uniref:YkgJ family cysteine cluster protein n=1 Tax=uncultured Prochlorococcus sp. TaxID=159733 RepID=UPI002587EFCA|nr:YkgJ family cysteine cluster protein [uncultured Prochlorococcus sp.]
MKSWTCIENCGACCKFNLNERSYLEDKLNKKDIALINSMTDKDGWCKNLDRENKKCLIYENRPHFCRVNKFSIAFKGYLKYRDKFLIDCCKQHISSNYGYKSKEMKNFKIAISEK